MRPLKELIQNGPAPVNTPINIPPVQVPVHPHHHHCHHWNKCYCGYCYACGRYTGRPAPYWWWNGYNWVAKQEYGIRCSH